MEAHYKKLNTELIAEVQSLRCKLGIMRKNEVLLQAQLVDDRVMQQEELTRAVIKFVQTLGISIGSQLDDEHANTEKSIQTKRRTRSTSSVERRSMAQTRSSLTTSPSDRRRSSTIRIYREADEIQQLEDEQHQHEEEDQQQPRRSVETRHKTPPPRHTADLEDDCESPISDRGTISEENASDNGIQLNMLLTVEEESTVDISSQVNSVATVSDDDMSLSVPGKARTPSPSGRVLRDLSLNVPTITIGRGKEKHVKHTLKVSAISCDTTNEDEAELSVQQVRQAASVSPASGMKLSLGATNSMTFSVTPRRSQFNNICDMPGCTSTPFTISPQLNGLQKKDHKKKQKKEEEEEDPQLNSTSTRRPSRSCRPTTLTEPKLHTKLRNESAPKKRKSSKPKSSS